LFRRLLFVYIHIYISFRLEISRYSPKDLKINTVPSFGRGVTRYDFDRERVVENTSYLNRNGPSDKIICQYQILSTRRIYIIFISIIHNFFFFVRASSSSSFARSLPYNNTVRVGMCCCCCCCLPGGGLSVTRLWERNGK